MARPTRSHALSVWLNARLVGRLTRDASGGVSFAYDQNWLGWEHALPVSLSLPLGSKAYRGAPVMAVFDNLLPDNAEIRRRAAERVGAEGVDAYSLLAALGRDCVGALQFLPEEAEPSAVGAIEGEPVSDEAIGEMIDNLAIKPARHGLKRR